MRKHIYSIVILGIVASGCNFFDRKELPEALSVEEVEESFPDSETLEKSIYEIAMLTQGLVDIQSLDESIKVDLKYSSADNFFGYDVYGNLELAYFQKEVAEALVQANKILKEKKPNLTLLIYDGARPLTVQEVLWEELDSLPRTERRRYVTDPSEVSLHNYGCAVDLTLFDEERGKPLDMGTPFDYFGELAYPRLEKQMLNEGKLSLKQVANRNLLRSVMNEVGFTPITSEWWHFNFHSREVAKNKYKVIP